jgi:hypothetical protein
MVEGGTLNRIRIAAVGLGLALLCAGCSMVEGPANPSHLGAADLDQLRTWFVFVQNETMGVRQAAQAVVAWKASHPGIDHAVYGPDRERLLDLQRQWDGWQQNCAADTASYNELAGEHTPRAFVGADVPRHLAATDPMFTSGRARWADYDCGVLR